MRIFAMILKEIKQQLRDRNGIVFSIAFPIVLTLVLGFSLSNMFSEDIGPSKIYALYSIESSSPLASSFREDLLPNAEKQNLFLAEEKDVAKALDKVKEGSAGCFIQVFDDRIGITMREGGTMSGQIAETIIKAYVKTFDAYMAVAKIKPLALAQMSRMQTEEAPEYVKSVSLQKNKTPRALDYYALTMITLIIMYSGPAGSAVITDERQLGTLSRMLISPVSKAEILISKITGLCLSTALQVAIVVLFDKFLLKTEWGNHLPAVAALLFAQIIMVISAGVGLAYLFKETTTGTTILNIIIPVLIFLGGGYVNLELMGITGFISKLAYLSPVKWLNQSLLQIIYANDFSSFGTTIAICLGISVIFLALSSVLSKKEVYA